MKSIIDTLTLSALFLLAISVLTSITLMAGFHVLMIPPILYYVFKYDWKKYPASAWALLAFSVIVVLSVVFNQDIMPNGFKNINKVKYFIIGALSIIPLQFYFQQLLKNENSDRIIKSLLWVFIIAATAATVSGLIAFQTGYNILKLKAVQTNRNSGMFGMIITYAHSVALYSTLLVSMLVHREKIKKWIPSWVLATSLVISITGLIYSYTRGALLAFLVSLIFINRKIATYGIACIVVIGIGISIVKPSFIHDHILRQESNNERIGCWLSAIAAFKERPILGYGFQNLEDHSGALKVKYNIRNSYFTGDAHNNFLEILATTGVLGFSFFMLWLILWCRDLIKKKDLMTTIIFPFWVCFIVGGLTQVTINDGENAFFIMIFFALSYMASAMDNKLYKNS